MKFIINKEFKFYHRRWVGGSKYEETFLFKIFNVFIYKCEYNDPEYYKFYKIIWN